jgi:NAD(P)-dependent dehydrogenase (short-subunit alcohol dehydrogenase family)
VADAASVRSAVAAVVHDLGSPQVVCNIAGVGRFAHTVDMPLSDWDRIIAVNLTGTFLVCQATLPHLLETRGNIVNTASTAGIKGQPYSAAYCASKGGVALLTKSLACEYLERGVRVNAIAPGGIETPILEHFAPPEGASRRLMARIETPMGFGTPEEVAALVAYVASDEARYMTGAIVSLDGGVTV